MAMMVDWDTHWYGRDCTYPSSGWKASAAHGVGTVMSLASAPAGRGGQARGRRSCGRLTDPFMMWLVNVLVHAGVMLQAMNPVDGKIVESQVQY